MQKDSFFQALGLQENDVVALAGAGGKTSLMFCLAQEAKGRGCRVLVTTSTKMFVPERVSYDRLDLSGRLFGEDSCTAPGIYVAGAEAPIPGKMTGVEMGLLAVRRRLFNLVLLEADGAAAKPLKGWHRTEPVIPPFTTKTIGVLDIQTIGRKIDASLVHRLEIFTGLTGGKAGDAVNMEHLTRVVCHDEGLFAAAKGEKILYINKVESVADRRNVDEVRVELQTRFKKFRIVAGSTRQGTIYG